MPSPARHMESKKKKPTLKKSVKKLQQKITDEKPQQLTNTQLTTKTPIQIPQPKNGDHFWNRNGNSLVTNIVGGTPFYLHYAFPDLFGKTQQLTNLKEKELFQEFEKMKIDDNVVKKVEEKKVVKSTMFMKSKADLQESHEAKAQYKEYLKNFKNLSYDESIKYAKSSLKSLPKSVHWRVYLDLADLYKRENYLSKSRKLFAKVNDIQPYSSQAWLEYSKLEEECGNLEKCKELIKTGLIYCPYNESLLVKGIKLYEQLKDFTTARSYLSRLKTIPVDKCWKTILEGALLESRIGNFIAARNIFRYLIQNVRRHGPIYYEAYKLEERLESNARALEIVKEGLEANPRYGPLWFALLTIYEKIAISENKQKPDLKKVRETVEKAIESISRELRWKVYFEQAQVEERAGNYDLARAAYVQSVVKSLKNLRWKIWMAGARTELKAGQQEKAKELLKQALNEVPTKTRSIVLIECARLEEFIGNINNARTFLKTAQKEAQHEWKVFLESILLEMRSGDLKSALREAENALKIHRRTGRLWAVYIQLKHLEGNSENLLKVFGEALREVPKSGEVWCEGARIRMNPLSPKFDLEKAKQHLDFAVKFTPQYGDSFIEVLRLQHLTTGPQVEEIENNIEQLCINADPNYGPLWFHCKESALDTTNQILKRSKKMLIREMEKYKDIYQRRIIDQQSLANSPLILNEKSLFPKFITGLPSLNLMSCKSLDLEQRRKIIFGFSDNIV